MIDPLGDQAECLALRCFRMMEAIERCASLECPEIARSMSAKIAIGGDDSAFAAPADSVEVTFCFGDPLRPATIGDGGDGQGSFA